MMHTPDMASYGHTAAYINYQYCAKNGYAFIVERCPRRQDMGKDWMWDDNNGYLLVWSKPALVLRHLPNYDYLLYIDSDAVVTDQDMKVEDFVEKHADKDTCILASQDCRYTGYCYSHGLNAGTLLFVNTPKTIQIIKEWIESPNKLCPDWKYTHTREQMCLNIMREKFYDKQIKVLHSADMNGSDGTWIKHYMATSGEDRHQFIRGHFRDLFHSECLTDEQLLDELMMMSSTHPPYYHHDEEEKEEKKKSKKKKKNVMGVFSYTFIVLFCALCAFVIFHKH